MRGRAGIIEKQKNKLPRPLWTARGRSELRKKLEPSCLPSTLTAVPWVALGPEREDRRQRKSGLKPARSDTIAICESHLFPRHRGQFPFAIVIILCKAFGISL